MQKDRNGTLWVGTQNGLSRFDGKNFYNFKRSKSGNSIPNNTIQSLCEDEKGNIWGGTENGIFKFDILSNKFIHYHCPKGVFNNIVFNIICDEAGNIYATTTYELLILDEKKDQFNILFSFADHNKYLPSTTIGKNCLMKHEKSNTLWIATQAGLYAYLLKEKKLIGNSDFPDNELFYLHNKRAMTNGSDGQYIVFDNTTTEIVIFNPENYKIVKKIDFKKIKPSAFVISQMLDRQDVLWLSTVDNHVYTIDLKKDGWITQIKRKEDGDFSMSSTSFWFALEDKNGCIWFGTGNGISVTSPGISLYHPMFIADKIPEIKASIFKIYEDKIDHHLWLFTVDNLIYNYNPINNKYKIYTSDDVLTGKYGSKPTQVFNFYNIGQDIIIVTNAGTFVLDKHTQKWKPHIIPFKGYENFEVSIVHELDSIAYLSDEKEIVAYNLITHRYKKIFPDSDLKKEKKPITISHLISDSKKNLIFVAYRNYIGKLENNKIKIIELFPEDSLKNVGYFITARIDKNDVMWIGHKGICLIKYNLNTGEKKYLSDFDGWGNNHVHRIIEDDKNNIWTVYFNKVSCYNTNENTFTNFSVPYGESELDYYNSLIKTHEGRILSAVGKDVFELRAEDFNKKPIHVIPAFNSINISGNNYFGSHHEIARLNHNETSIQIDFGLLIDPIAYPHTFDYILEGLDQNWTKAASLNQVNYSKLPPGKYTFRVIARGQNKSWVSQENSFTFIIATPYYKHPLFFTIVALIIGLFIYNFYKYRLRQFNKVMTLESKAQNLEKEKAQMMYDGLKQQLNPHFLFNSLTSLSALIEADQEMASSFLDQMSDMYRYILKNGNEETVTLKEEINFVTTYYNLQKTRFGKGLVVNIDVPQDKQFYKIAPVTLQNMIENAIKHNIIDVDAPLMIDICIEDDYIIVKNNLQPKLNVETSNKRGLQQFKSLYQYLSSKPVIIDQNEDHYIIKIPLI